MKLEVIKSIILSALILFSIMFTIAIWNYQPNLEGLGTTDYTDPQLSGVEQTKKQIIEPSKVIFHLEEDHYRLRNLEEENQLYNSIQNLSLLEFEPVSEADGLIHGEQLEFIFPVSLSSRTLSDLFAIEEENIPVGGLFDRMSISLSDERQLSEIQFIDTKNNEKFIAHARRNDIEGALEGYLDEENLLEQLVVEGKDDQAIYLPAEEPELYDVVYSVSSFTERPELDPLINVLFSDPGVVLQNPISGGEQYTDARRELRVLNNYMEYVNPLAEYKEMDRWSLIDQSLSFINAHHGWTISGEDEYQLYNVNTTKNTVTYRMTFEEYPVFDEYNRLTTINLTIHNQLVYEYNRPLIQLQDPLNVKDAEIGSGEEAIMLIEQNKELSLSKVEDITIGYKLVDQQGAVQLVPTWYYRDSSSWKELPVPEIVNRGGV